MILSGVAGVAVIALILGAVMLLARPSGEPGTPQPNAQAGQEVQVNLASLTESNTHTKIAGAPTDPRPAKPTDGTVVHPRKPIAIYTEPKGKPIAKIGPQQLGKTWLPVVDERAGWVRVLLPSKPNGSTGWLRDSGLQKAVTPYEIRVHLTSMTMELLREGRELGSWSIGIGKPDTPTPTGRTFLLGSFVDPNQKYSPVILPLGSHSDTLNDFGGGPGTVAIHTWPTTDVFGAAVSHGCIRVPKDALSRLTEVPLGTLVLVDQK